VSVRAAVDIGSNSVRLLVVDADGVEQAREQIVTRLAAGRLEATADALRLLAGRCDELGVGPGARRVTATAAVRDAADRPAMVRTLSEAIGAPVVVLPAASEGRLAFAGATDGLDARHDEWYEPAWDVVVDIGGGSTEFTVGRPGEEPLGTWSVPIGCVRITETFLHGDPPTAEELSQAISVIDAHLDDVDRELPAVREATRMVGVAGTITTVAAVELGRFVRDEIHRMWLTRAAAEDVFRTVATETAADRAHNPGLHPDRVATIVGGAAILVAVMRHYGVEGLLVSESDSLDALAALDDAVWARLGPAGPAD
jgi:exopolyphosphatase/guanosine-5'-triphosphate,3'-diphosphate pyrophosphatase